MCSTRGDTQSMHSQLFATHSFPFKDFIWNLHISIPITTHRISMLTFIKLWGHCQQESCKQVNPMIIPSNSQPGGNHNYHCGATCTARAATAHTYICNNPCLDGGGQKNIDLQNFFGTTLFGFILLFLAAPGVSSSWLAWGRFFFLRFPSFFNSTLVNCAHACALIVLAYVLSQLVD